MEAVWFLYSTSLWKLLHWFHLYMRPSHLCSWNFPVVPLAFQHLETPLGCQKSLRSQNCENSRRHLPKGAKTLTAGLDCSVLWHQLSIICIQSNQSTTTHKSLSGRQKETSCFYFRGRERRGSTEYKATCILWPSVKTHTHTRTHRPNIHIHKTHFDQLCQLSGYTMQIYLKKERKGENVEGGVLEPCSLNTHKQATDSLVSQWQPLRLPSLMVT